MMIRALTKNRSTYKIVFNSPDYHATVTALETGIGLAALPRRSIPSPLVEAKEYYLPALPLGKTLLCARPELEIPQAEKLLRRITETLFASAKTDAA
jgi:DNA-binding transcriptional LysR family regulator